MVYADGTASISRPVTDSFALFTSSGLLKERGGVGVEPQNGTYTAREDLFGPAVLSDLFSYYDRHVSVEPLWSDADFDPQEANLLLRPTYRSGSGIRIGRPQATNLSATLVWADGEPVAPKSGVLNGPDGTTVEFITNREGVTYLYGLSPGSYESASAGNPDAKFSLVVPAEPKVELDLGTIRIPTVE
ncbi:MAG: hypothetical protein N3G20_02805 [Verrucomicrobiae bacterium]|nr:hypothetical protein [Verrucomicrobiae bacterium]